MNDEKPESATPIQLAILAALIDPEGCRKGHNRDALFRAMSLLRDSAALSDEMAEKSDAEQAKMLAVLASTGSQGARQLLDALTRINKPPEPMLTLAEKDEEEDTLRPYLEQHCNLEGKTGRKSWSRVRTVLDNFRAWITSRTNELNILFAAQIYATEERLKRLQEQFAAGSVLHDEIQGYHYRDPEGECWEFFIKHQISDEDGRALRYEFSQDEADGLISWKRRIRTAPGGLGAVRALTREEILDLGKPTLPKSDG
jgi:hypothetical protein